MHCRTCEYIAAIAGVGTMYVWFTSGCADGSTGRFSESGIVHPNVKICESHGASGLFRAGVSAAGASLFTAGAACATSADGSA
jgi:hypothetical protein